MAMFFYVKTARCTPAAVNKQSLNPITAHFEPLLAVLHDVRSARCHECFNFRSRLISNLAVLKGGGLKVRNHSTTLSCGV